MASFAEIQAKAPKIKTRQALMIIGLQNDFITPTGHLPLDFTGFLDNIHTLIPKFRELHGHIIWVKSQYEADRLANIPAAGEGDALVIAGLVDGDENSSQAGDNESTKDLPLPTPQAQSRSAKHKQRALDLFKRVSSRRKALPVEEAKAEVEEDEELFLLKRAKKNPACMPGTEGAQFRTDFKDLVQSPQDAVITTSNYSAFLGTNLLLTLRARLVTEIYVCGCMSNVSVLATVIDGARHGIKINVIQDALGFRKQTRHDLALKRMEDFFDAWLVTSADILAKEHLTIVEPEKEEAKAEAKDSKKSTDELEAKIGNLSLNEKDFVASAQPNGRETSATEEQSDAKPTLVSQAQDNEVLEPMPSDQDFVLEALARRRGKGAEQQPADAAEPRLVQSKTRMRKKKKKKPTEGSSAESAVPNGRSSDTATPGATEPTTATREEVESLQAAALQEEAKGGVTPELNGTGEPMSASKIPEVVESMENGSKDGIDTAPTKVTSNDPITGTTPARKSPTTPPTDTSTFDATTIQSTSKNLKTPRTTDIQPATMTKNSKLKSLANLPVLGPGDHIAEGDSRIIHDLIPPESRHPSNSSKPLADTIFQQLYSEVRWQTMLHQQGEVPRLVCCQGEFGDDGSKPVYRHPADQTLPLLHFSPKVQYIRRAAEKLVGHPLNHVLIQLYRSGNDFISEHSDKTLDIAKDSSIVNVSFGAQRTMRLRTKRDQKAKSGGGDDDSQRETQRVALPHNSMFVLGLKSNEKWLHGIMADKRLEAERSDPETAYSGARISLTFRHIATFLDAKETVIWGQGATSKDQRGAADVVNNDAAEAERMIRAFSRENHSNDFSWDEWYGEGFDVLHLHQPPEQVPSLFASNSALETKQIQLALWEAKINHTLLEAPDLDKEHGSGQKLVFRDNDTHFTEVEGVAATLHYLDRYHSFCADRPVTAVSYSLLEHLAQVVNFFPDHKAKPAPLREGPEQLDLTAALHMLSEQLKNHGGPFIAGARFSIADCVVWPVLDECVAKWEGWDELAWPGLAEYYRSSWKRKACMKKLRAELPAATKKA